MADALSQVIWIGVFLALALPEAGLAGLWVDATVIQIGRDMNASQEQERVIHSVAMDAQGAILNLEKFASQVRSSGGPFGALGTLSLTAVLLLFYAAIRGWPALSAKRQRGRRAASTRGGT